VQELQAALATFDQDALDARVRLAIEAVVRPVALDLGNVMRLVDMLGPKAGADSTTIDLYDAFAVAARRSSERVSVTPVLAVVEGPTRELRVRQPRLVLDLLEFAVATVVGHGVESPRILVDPSASAFPQLVVDSVPPGGGKPGAPASRRTLDIVLHAMLPMEADVVRAAARQAGIQLAVAEDGTKVTIGL
jgi:hypothetical protein